MQSPGLPLWQSAGFITAYNETCQHAPEIQDMCRLDRVWQVQDCCMAVWTPWSPSETEPGCLMIQPKPFAQQLALHSLKCQSCCDKAMQNVAKLPVLNTPRQLPFNFSKFKADVDIIGNIVEYSSWEQNATAADAQGLREWNETSLQCPKAHSELGLSLFIIAKAALDWTTCSFEPCKNVRLKAWRGWDL